MKDWRKIDGVWYHANYFRSLGEQQDEFMDYLKDINQMNKEAGLPQIKVEAKYVKTKVNSDLPEYIKSQTREHQDCLEPEEQVQKLISS